MVVPGKMVHIFLTRQIGGGDRQGTHVGNKVVHGFSDTQVSKTHCIRFRVSFRNWCASSRNFFRLVLLFAPMPLFSPLLQIINRAISTFLIKRTGLTHSQPQTDFVALI